MLHEKFRSVYLTTRLYDSLVINVLGISLFISKKSIAVFRILLAEIVVDDGASEATCTGGPDDGGAGTGGASMFGVVREL
jgi:hypothetical protein